MDSSGWWLVDQPLPSCWRLDSPTPDGFDAVKSPTASNIPSILICAAHNNLFRPLWAFHFTNSLVIVSVYELHDDADRRIQFRYRFLFGRVAGGTVVIGFHQVEAKILCPGEMADFIIKTVSRRDQITEPLRCVVQTGRRADSFDFSFRIPSTDGIKANAALFTVTLPFEGGLLWFSTEPRRSIDYEFVVHDQTPFCNDSAISSDFFARLTVFFGVALFVAGFLVFFGAGVVFTAIAICFCSLVSSFELFPGLVEINAICSCGVRITAVACRLTASCCLILILSAKLILFMSLFSLILLFKTTLTKSEIKRTLELGAP